MRTAEEADWKAEELLLHMRVVHAAKGESLFLMLEAVN